MNTRVVIFQYSTVSSRMTKAQQLGKMVSPKGHFMGMYQYQTSKTYLNDLQFVLIKEVIIQYNALFLRNTFVVFLWLFDKI